MIAITEGKEREVIRGFDDGCKELFVTEPDVMHLAFICSQWLAGDRSIPTKMEGLLDVEAVGSIATKLADLYHWEASPGTWGDAIVEMGRRSSYTP